MISAKFSEVMVQSVIIDNRGGAGGTIGVDHVAKSAPDEYSMVLSSTSLGIYPHVQSNRLRAIAITAARRAALLPDLPSMAEQGVPKVDASNWYGILVAGITPREVIDRLNAGLNKALADKDLRDRLTARGAESAPGTPEQLTARLKADYNKWGPIVKAAGVKLD